MNHIERIERAIETPEYQTYGAMAAAALVGAILETDKARRSEAFKNYADLLRKQSEVVRRV